MRLRRRGFSLIEIMFVIVIIGILMAIGTGQYRRMQDNSEFNNQMDLLAGEIRALPKEAQAVGENPSPAAKGGNGTLTFNGRFRWRTFKNGQVIKEGKLGERQELTLKISSSFGLRTLGTPQKGVWLQLEQFQANGTATPIGVVVFRPDNTPLDVGDIYATNKHHGMRIQVKSQGSIEGPTAEA